MKKTIEIINSLEKEGVISGYAMGGATALLFYAEPDLTFDVDIFVLISSDKDKNGIITLSPIYKTLEAKGYKAQKEHIIIEGIPVQFIPAYNPLVEEAVNDYSIKEYERVKVKVLKIEYLFAIMVDTNRPKDRGRILKLLDEVTYDKNLLKTILKRHSLLDKWEKLVEKK